MTHRRRRLRTIAKSPFAADLRAGRFDRALVIAAVLGVVLIVGFGLGDQYWTPTGYQPIPTGQPR